MDSLENELYDALHHFEKKLGISNGYKISCHDLDRHNKGIVFRKIDDTSIGLVILFPCTPFDIGHVVGSAIYDDINPGLRKEYLGLFKNAMSEEEFLKRYANDQKFKTYLFAEEVILSCFGLDFSRKRTSRDPNPDDCERIHQNLTGIKQIQVGHLNVARRFLDFVGEDGYLPLLELDAYQAASTIANPTVYFRRLSEDLY